MTPKRKRLHESTGKTGLPRHKWTLCRAANTAYFLAFPIANPLVVSGKFLRRNGNQILFHVFSGFNQITEMLRCQPCAPRVCHRVAGLLRQFGEFR